MALSSFSDSFKLKVGTCNSDLCFIKIVFYKFSDKSI